MRPDRIGVGEVRSGEALGADLLAVFILGRPAWHDRAAGAGRHRRVLPATPARSWTQERTSLRRGEGRSR